MPTGADTLGSLAVASGVPAELPDIMAPMAHSRGKNSAWFWLLAAAAGFPSAPAPAQIISRRLPLPGESRATANRLAATDKLVTTSNGPRLSTNIYTSWKNPATN